MRLSKYGVGFSILVGVLAVLGSIKTSPDLWVTKKKAVFAASKERLWNYLTDLGTLEQWFSYFSSIEEFDGLPLMVGKKYILNYKILLFKYTVVMSVTKLEKHSEIELVGDGFLKPVFRAKIRPDKQKPDRNFLSLSVHSSRDSLLVQWTLAPIFHVVSSNQLSRALIFLQFNLGY